MAHTQMGGIQIHGAGPVIGRDRPHRAARGDGQAAAGRTRLDLKALRMAVHGWRLGNPLVYKPGVPDPMAIARELADAGAAAGTLVIGDAPAATGTGLDPAVTLASPCDRLAAVLILRPLPPQPHLPSSALLVEAALRAVAATAQTFLGPDSPCSCAIDTAEVVMVRREPIDGQPAARLCSVRVEVHAGVALVSLRFALDQLGVADGAEGQRRAEGELAATTRGFLARPDWREVFLARMLHALEGRLKELP